MKKVGLFFGTFNPVHVGHLVIANYFAESAGMKEVWFVVSPQNPLKDKASLLEDHHRLAMVREAVYDNPRLKACNIEFDLPKPSYTVYTLQVLKEKHPDLQFSLILGEDNLRSFHRWKNYGHIIENYDLLVYPRIDDSTEKSGANPEIESHPRVKRVPEVPVMNISSSFIRAAIKNRKDVRYLLTQPVHRYLTSMNFYT